MTRNLRENAPEVRHFNRRELIGLIGATAAASLGGCTGGPLS
jgi:hypothetical protein